jgi:hypothetical protein
MSVYVGVAETAAERARVIARKRGVMPQLLGELENALTGAQLAVDSMTELAADLEFEPSNELSSAMLVRKTLASNAVIDAAAKALAWWVERALAATTCCACLCIAVPPLPGGSSRSSAAAQLGLDRWPSALSAFFFTHLSRSRIDHRLIHSPAMACPYRDYRTIPVSASNEVSSVIHRQPEQHRPGHGVGEDRLSSWGSFRAQATTAGYDWPWSLVDQCHDGPAAWHDDWILPSCCPLVKASGPPGVRHGGRAGPIAPGSGESVGSSAAGRPTGRQMSRSRPLDQAESYKTNLGHDTPGMLHLDTGVRRITPEYHNLE